MSKFSAFLVGSLFCILLLSGCSYSFNFGDPEDSETVKVTETKTEVKDVEVVKGEKGEVKAPKNLDASLYNDKCGYGNVDSDGKCDCIEGHVWDETKKCISMEADCKNLYGENAYSRGYEGEELNQCYCKAGYDWNRNDSLCVKIVCENGKIDSDGYCLCNDNFYYQPDMATCLDANEDCRSIYGANSFGSGENEDGVVQCYCKNGFGWSEDGASCVTKS